MALRILGATDPAIAELLDQFAEQLKEDVAAMNRDIATDPVVLPQ